LVLVPTNQEKIFLIQEEIKILQAQLEEIESPEKQAQILQPTNQPYGIPSSSKN